MSSIYLHSQNLTRTVTHKNCIKLNTAGFVLGWTLYLYIIFSSYAEFNLRPKKTRQRQKRPISVSPLCPCGCQNILTGKEQTIKKRTGIGKQVMSLSVVEQQPISYFASLNLSFWDFIFRQFKAIIREVAQRWIFNALRISSYKEINGILAVNLSFWAVYLQLYPSSLIKKEAAVEQSNQLFECVSAHNRLLQTKPVEIDGFETCLARFPLIICSHLHLSLSLLMPWLCFELRVASSDSRRLLLTCSNMTERQG